MSRIILAKNKHQLLEWKMDKAVEKAAGKGIDVELLWSVFETRLRRAIRGGNER